MSFRLEGRMEFGWYRVSLQAFVPYGMEAFYFAH